MSAPETTQPTFNSNLDKFFEHKVREGEIYAKWEQASLFKLENTKNKTAPVFNIAMPPPNANGELHLGHSFGYTLMDILGRFHRLLGERVLLLPGKDHAGIQTQVVFEKKLKAEKVDIKAKSTEALYQECYDFCMNRAEYMRSQEKRLGLSADWSKELFTLDPRLSSIVYETFERMWKDGLIYKGSRIVNWSVFSQTSISDVEVEYKEADGGLWYISYPLVVPYQSTEELTLPSGQKIKVGEFGIVTATTRPETMLGDTALAVHPEDPRYKALIGKEAIVPLVNRKVKIVGDTRVDPTYGTGVIKVTPAHDFADFDIGQDHKLEIIQVIGKDGKMTDAAGESFKGKTTVEAREQVVAQLTEAKLLLDTVTIKHKVPISERGKDIIEPLISEQWFVNVDKPGKSLKENALKLIRGGKINIYPARFQVLFEQWLENLRDWNISRQLWWGHRLPVWYRNENGKEEIAVGEKKPTGSGWTQETDIFDTWFSSGQWAFSTQAAHGLCNLDKPEENREFFPTHTMVMGKDILLFWACRMLILTAYRTGDIPWKNIFFTGLIHDEHGQKMSKSKGNGIDPIAIIEKYGTDSLRLGLIIGATPGNDISLGEKKIEGYSKFINKVWNAAKLLEMKLGTQTPPPHATPLTLESSKWILNEVAKTHAKMTKQLKEYELSMAADEAYGFTWTIFCDWYLEIMKVLIDKGDKSTLDEVRYAAATTFRAVLTMLHPFVPYFTEEIYQKLPFIKKEAFLATGTWNALEGVTSAEAPTMATMMEIVTAVRSVKAAINIPHKRIRAVLPIVPSPEIALLISELARVDFCTSTDISAEKALRKPVTAGTLILEVDDKEAYRIRVEKDLATNRVVIETIEKKLSGAFAQHAKPEIVAQEREKLAVARHAVLELQKELALFK